MNFTVWNYRLRRRLRNWLRPAPRGPDGFAPAGGQVVVIAPHPDDEIVGCGGTMRRHLLAGDSVCVVYLTRGEASRGYPWLSPQQTAQAREQEARKSAGVLGVTDLFFLDGRDAHLHEAAVFNPLLEQLVSVLASRTPKLIYAPHEQDNHPDHTAALRLVEPALRRLTPQPACEVRQYEVWSPLRADFAIDITPLMSLKLKALRCHRLALDAFDYIATTTSLATYRCGTMLQHPGYAEAFKRV